MFFKVCLVDWLSEQYFSDMVLVQKKKQKIFKYPKWSEWLWNGTIRTNMLKSLVDVYLWSKNNRFIQPYRVGKSNIQFFLGPITGDKNRRIVLPIWSPDPAQDKEANYLNFLSGHTRNSWVCCMMWLAVPERLYGAQG